MPHVRFEHELRGADWDEAAGHWRLDTSQGELTADVLMAGQGPAERAEAARRARHRELRGHDVPLGRLGPRPRPERRARGGDRHRRVGDPVRARDPARGWRAARLPAHPALGHAAPQPADERFERPLPPPARGAAWRCGRGSTGRASRSCSSSGNSRMRKLATRMALRQLETRCRTPSCASAHAALRDGLQAHPAHRRVVSGAPAAQRRAV